MVVVKGGSVEKTCLFGFSQGNWFNYVTVVKKKSAFENRSNDSINSQDVFNVSPKRSTNGSKMPQRRREN
jgi:hypothetical protein